MTYNLNPNFNNEDDFSFETPEGLPEAPPEGERILWTGMPSARDLGVRMFAVKWIAAFAIVLAVSSFFSPLHANATLIQHAMIATSLLAAGALAIGFALFWGWLVAINTRYTITNERVVIRHGVTMPMSINVPFAKIATASSKVRRDGSGDVSVALLDGNRVSWFAIYPHNRSWTWQGTQPAFRSIP
ncbi:MAG: photosynthetic complex putative assembly protein PuhB, partial [Pseudomonadota bacterium]